MLNGLARYAKCFGLQPRFLGHLAKDIKILLKKYIYIYYNNAIILVVFYYGYNLGPKVSIQHRFLIQRGYH